MFLAAAMVVFLDLQNAPWQTAENVTRCLFYCSFSEGINLQVAHIAAKSKVSFDMGGFKGEATLLVF